MSPLHLTGERRIDGELRTQFAQKRGGEKRGGQLCPHEDHHLKGKGEKKMRSCRSFSSRPFGTYIEGEGKEGKKKEGIGVEQIAVLGFVKHGMQKGEEKTVVVNPPRVRAD